MRVRKVVVRKEEAGSEELAPVLDSIVWWGAVGQGTNHYPEKGGPWLLPNLLLRSCRD